MLFAKQSPLNPNDHPAMKLARHGQPFVWGEVSTGSSNPSQKWEAGKAALQLDENIGGQDLDGDRRRIEEPIRNAHRFALILCLALQFAAEAVPGGWIDFLSRSYQISLNTICQERIHF